MNAERAAAQLTEEQKESLHEVADLLLQIYQTLLNMRYISPESLVQGPHTFSEEILATYKKCELDPSIVYLYSIMPYIEETETDARDFFQGSMFFNPLDKSDVTHGRDPCYLCPEGGFDEENGKYMYPWYTPLSLCGNHSPMMIYDARRHVIWNVDQINRTSTDPAYCKWYVDPENVKEESCWGESDSSDWIDDSDGNGDNDDIVMSDNCSSNGSSEFWSDGDDMVDTDEVAGMVADQAEEMDYDEGFEPVEKPDEWELHQAALDALKNKNSLEAVRSRAAGEMLRDINHWYQELKEFPGQGEHSLWLRPEILKPLYLKNGWPFNFDGDKFEVDYVRAHAADRACWWADNPLQEVKCYEGWIEGNDRDIERYKKDIDEATTIDDEWEARFELWKAEERTERNTQDLKDAKEIADRMCPGGVCQKSNDLPLWELEMLRVEAESKYGDVQHWAALHQSEQADAKTTKWAKSQYRQAQHKLEVHEKAFRASKIDAERLCPGTSFTEATGITTLGRPDPSTGVATQEKLEKYYKNLILATRAFASTVPRTATSIITKVEKEIKEHETTLERIQGELDRLRTSSEQRQVVGNTIVIR